MAASVSGSRLTDQLSIGVLTRAIPRSQIEAVLASTGKASQRQRQLPAHVVVYYVIALALFRSASYREVLRLLLDGLRWIAGRDGVLVVATKSALSQARTRLGEAPLEGLFAAVARPLAVAETRGAFWRGRRLVSLDSTLLDIADTPANRLAFGGPAGARGPGAYPQLRVLALVETGTHAVIGARQGAYDDSEVKLARLLLPQLSADMLCLCDRGFWGYSFWRKAQATGAALVWRAKTSLQLERHRRDLPDGSYLSKIYLPKGRGRTPKRKLRTGKRRGLLVRVIDYQLDGAPDPEQVYRVITNLLDPASAPAHELAALYAERWEQEGVFDEIKAHLRGARIVLRSQTPDLVRQEVWGLLLAHYAVRGLMHEAALSGQEDPDRLSFVHSVGVVRRSLPQWAAFSPSQAPGPTPGRAGRSAAGTTPPQASPRYPARRQTPDQQVPLATQTTKPSDAGQHHGPRALRQP